MNKVRGSNIIMKLDISKAYDTLSCQALIKVMRKFGVDERRIDKIWSLISNFWYSILINGVSCGYFASNIGLRQWDPLSPFLYIIISETISRGLNTLYAKFPSVRYYSSSNCSNISYLSYADDIIIFCNGSCNSIKKHMEFFDKVYKFLGLEINKAKSCFKKEISISSKDIIIKSITGFQKQRMSSLQRKNH